MNGKYRRGLAALGLAFGIALEANAQDPCRNEERWEGFNILVDQDVFHEPAFDQDYTMGVEFVAQGCFVRDARLTAPLEWIDHALRIGRTHETLWEQLEREEASFTGHSVSFGNVAFTPAKAQLGETAPLHDDRPYANLLYVKVRRASARGDRAFVSDLTFGILGLRLGEWVQTKIHEGRDVLPGGWPNQISDGFEPTLKYRVSERRRLVDWRSGAKRDPWGFDLAASIDASAGYYTSVAWGLSARAGLIRSPWWAFERNAIADVRLARQNPRRSAGGRGDPVVREAYAWASAGTTAWLYNGLLQGQFANSKVRLEFDPDSAAPLRRLTSDAQAGGTLRLKYWGIGLTYGVQWLTPTFGGPKSRVHSWGSIYLTFQ